MLGRSFLTATPRLIETHKILLRNSNSISIRMIKEAELSINFSGLTHDHSILSHQVVPQEHDGATSDTNLCSTIAILRRHPMYDCIVLVKKYRACLEGYSLEFPLTCEDNDEEDGRGQENVGCNKRRLVSKFLDGDDPIYQSCCHTQGSQGEVDQVLSQRPRSPMPLANTDLGCTHIFGQQLDDNGQPCELVHVPINGLLDRLANYTSSNVAVDSRVYAFAMGLKTAERMMTTSNMRELQETPI